MSGREIGPPPPNRNSAGHANACDPEYTPFDAHPMLTLVPMAT
jgi:hypothetical protein